MKNISEVGRIVDEIRHGIKLLAEDNEKVGVSMTVGLSVLADKLLHARDILNRAIADMRLREGVSGTGAVLSLEKPSATPDRVTPSKGV